MKAGSAVGSLVFMALGIAMRLLRFGLNYPLWRDEAYLAWNLLDRDYAGLTRPLDYQQVCPLLFLWAGEGDRAWCSGSASGRCGSYPRSSAIASLFVFRHVAGRLLKGVAS